MGTIAVEEAGGGGYRGGGGGGGAGFDRDYRPRESRGGGGGRGGRDNNFGPRPGDWMCGECGADVFASKNACFRCSAPKPYDAQPARGGGGPRQERGGGRANTRRELAPWARASDDTANIDQGMVMNMIQARDDARLSRDFATADDIRAVLREDWEVNVDDNLREW